MSEKSEVRPVGASMQQVTRWRFTVIGEVWIANLPAETIELYTDPSARGYRHTGHKRRGETLQPTALPGLTPTVTEIFG